MSIRKEFEEFCVRTRPTMSTDRDIFLNGKGDYTNISTRAAWQTWKYFEKKNNPKPKSCRGIKP